MSTGVIIGVDMALCALFSYGYVCEAGILVVSKGRAAGCCSPSQVYQRPGRGGRVLPRPPSTPGPRMNRAEEAFQKNVVQFLRFACGDDVVWFHVPNQKGTRKGWELGLLKAMGVLNGVADLVICWRTPFDNFAPCRVAFVELKAGRGKPSDDQEKFEASCGLIGAPYAECTTLEAVERALRKWGVPLHATVLPSGVFQRKNP